MATPEEQTLPAVKIEHVQPGENIGDIAKKAGINARHFTVVLTPEVDSTSNRHALKAAKLHEKNLLGGISDQVNQELDEGFRDNFNV